VDDAGGGDDDRVLLVDLGLLLVGDGDFGFFSTSYSGLLAMSTTNECCFG
jgi:hypothetical protein